MKDGLTKNKVVCHGVAVFQWLILQYRESRSAGENSTNRLLWRFFHFIRKYVCCPWLISELPWQWIRSLCVEFTFQLRECQHFYGILKFQQQTVASITRSTTKIKNDDGKIHWVTCLGTGITAKINPCSQHWRFNFQNISAFV